MQPTERSSRTYHRIQTLKHCTDHLIKNVTNKIFILITCKKLEKPTNNLFLYIHQRLHVTQMCIFMPFIKVADPSNFLTHITQTCRNWILHIVEKRKRGGKEETHFRRNNLLLPQHNGLISRTYPHITISGFKMLDLISLWGKTTPPLL